MIKLKLIGGELFDEKTQDGDLDVDVVVALEGHTAETAFCALLAGDDDWELTYDTTDEGWEEWATWDVVARAFRAVKKGKTVLIEGEPVGYDEIGRKFTEFRRKHNCRPQIIEDNSISLILGTGQ